MTPQMTRLRRFISGPIQFRRRQRSQDRTPTGDRPLNARPTRRNTASDPDTQKGPHQWRDPSNKHHACQVLVPRSKAWASLRPRRLLRRRDQALALGALASELAGPAHGFRLLAGALLGRLLIVDVPLHFAERAFALHLLLQRLEGLIDVVVADENLNQSELSCCALAARLAGPQSGKQRRRAYKNGSPEGLTLRVRGGPDSRSGRGCPRRGDQNLTCVARRENPDDTSEAWASRMDR